MKCSEKTSLQIEDRFVVGQGWEEVVTANGYVFSGAEGCWKHSNISLW